MSEEKEDSIENCPVNSLKKLDSEIELKEVLIVLWNSKRLIIVVTFLFFLASLVYALNTPDLYKSEALLSPTESDKSGGLSSLNGQFGGLASLAGVSLGSGADDKTKLTIEVLKSRKFISEFIQNHNILKNLMATESWDARSDTIIYNAKVFDIENNKWVRKVRFPHKEKPSMQEAYIEFYKIMKVVLDKDTGLTTLSVEHISPVIAQQWVLWLIEDINLEMKQRDVVEATKSTAFLTSQLERTNVTDIKTVLYKLIEEQTKVIMFAEVRDEYVFKTVDPPIITENKFKPNRAVICIIGFFLGATLGVIFSLINYFIRNK